MLTSIVSTRYNHPLVDGCLLRAVYAPPTPRNIESRFKQVIWSRTRDWSLTRTSLAPGSRVKCVKCTSISCAAHSNKESYNEVGGANTWATPTWSAMNWRSAWRHTNNGMDWQSCWYHMSCFTHTKWFAIHLIVHYRINNCTTTIRKNGQSWAEKIFWVQHTRWKSSL